MAGLFFLFSVSNTVTLLCYILSMKTHTKRNKIVKISEILGYLGMFLIHGAIVPTTIANILGLSNHTPPLNMVLLIQLGLLLFLIRAIAQKDLLYIISNGFGFAMQTTLLSIIVFG